MCLSNSLIKCHPFASHSSKKRGCALNIKVRFKEEFKGTKIRQSVKSYCMDLMLYLILESIRLNYLIKSLKSALKNTSFESMDI